MVRRLRCVTGFGFAVTLTAALALVACEDTTPDSGGPAPPSPCTTIVTCQVRGSGSTTPLPTGDTVRFAYVANTTDNTLSMFLVDAATGRLMPIGYVLVGAAPVAVATDPASKYLYVANRDDDSISGFTVEERTGTLLEMADSPFATGAEPVALLVDPTGEFLYTANQAGESISVFSIDATDGSLTFRATATTLGRSPASLAVNSASSFLFVGNSEIGTNPASVSSFSIDSLTGVLSPVDATLVGNGALSITLHPAGAFLYAVSDSAGDVALLSVDVGGNLAVPDPSTVTLGPGGASIIVTPGGAHAYAINRVDNTVQDYSVAVDGTLTAISTSPLDTGTAPSSLIVDPLAERLYVTNAGSADVSVFLIDGATGALTKGSTTRAQRGPQSLAFVTRGVAASAKAKYAFILNQGASTISSYDVNAVSGVLSPNGAQLLTGGLGIPRATAVDPFARFVYVAHASNEISAYRINAANGSLPSVDTVTAGVDPSVTVSVDPTAVTIEPSGRFAYAAGSSLAGSTGWQVVVLTIDQSTGELTEVTGAGLDIGTLPVSMTADPTGRFLYTVDSGSDSVSAFTIDPATGLLTSVGAALSVADDPRSVAVDASGRFAYVVSAGSTPNQIQGFAIDADTGALTSLMSPLATGTNPQAVAADPTGRFVYVANANANTITPYAIDIEEVIDARMGELTAGNVSTPTGTSPTALAVEPGGKFIYVTNQASNSLATYSISQTTGNLTRVSSASIPSGTLTTPIAIGLTLFIE
ncbi:MAG: beta-propeller fold lactonase family protein [Nitrospirota bacterium]